ncbi:MAG TPA: hypothetical protein VGO97_02790 [Solirubrobacterales bacterium]|jgi:hypothetical protein|nr:hypothetical protein [Solirubrobacterales bacterium]
MPIDSYSSTRMESQVIAIGPPATRARRIRHAIVLFCAIAAIAALSGCGDGSKNSDTNSSAAVAKAASTEVDVASFPQVDGVKSIEQIANAAGAEPDADRLLPASTDLVAGRETRFPFGIFDAQSRPIWGPTVMYVARSLDAPAQGPFAVKIHELKVAQKFRSKTSADDYGKIGSGFHVVDISLPKKANKIAMMTLTRVGDKVHAAATRLPVRSADPAPEPGEKAPSIKTDTLKSAGGDVSKIDTRVPPSDMHDISLDVALKQRKPIVLLFATPLLCASRVCGPVIDVASEVQSKVGPGVTFIHQEIYNDNDINKGYRKQVGQYGLPSEPFTFVIDTKGRISTALAGPFTTSELEAAIAKAKG